MPATYAQMATSSIGRKSPMEKRSSPSPTEKRASPRRESDRVQTWDNTDFPVLQSWKAAPNEIAPKSRRVSHGDPTAEIDGYLKETMESFVIPDESSAARRAAAILSHLRRSPVAPGGNLFGTFWGSSPSRI